MIRKQSHIIILLLLFFTINTTAKTDKKVALVWGNASYIGWQDLPVCTNDAAVIADKLYQLGFDTIMLQNGNLDEMTNSLRRFAKDSRDAGVSVFFYSGHAFNNGGYYLVPAMTKLDENDILLLDYFPAKNVLDVMLNNSRLSLLFFDACRVSGGLVGNPKGINIPQNIGLMNEKKSINDFDDNYDDTKARGYTIFYATEDEQKALTGNDGFMSPFSRSLAEHLLDRDEFRYVWQKIQTDVMKSTKQVQRPESKNIYTNNFYFNRPEYQSPFEELTRDTHDYNPFDYNESFGGAERIIAAAPLSIILDLFKNQQKNPLKSPLYAHQNNKQPIGLEVNSRQGYISWASYKIQKVGFVYIKATEGADDVDKNYYVNLTNARNSGMKVGSYHFFTSQSSVNDQFQNFITIAKKEDQDLIPVIDCESIGKWTPQQLCDSLALFAGLLEGHYGKKPMILSSEGFFNLYLGESFKNYPLWITKYSNEAPKIDAKWTLWQYSVFDFISGFNETTNVSVFNKRKSLKNILLRTDLLKCLLFLFDLE